MTNNFFITGTGTGIGKTIVTCSLISQLRLAGKNVAAIKPVITGSYDINSDTRQILASLGLGEEYIDKISPWRYKAPLAPSMAARLEGAAINYQQLLSYCKAGDKDYFSVFAANLGKFARLRLRLMQNLGEILRSHSNNKQLPPLAATADYFLCEGAGGVAVPFTNDKTSLNLMQDLGFPVILVAGTYLGAISHSISAVKTLECYNINIKSIIINESEHGISLSDTKTELQNFLPYPIYQLPRVHNNTGFIWQNTVNLLEAIDNNLIDC